MEEKSIKEMCNFCFRMPSKPISWHWTKIPESGWPGYLEVLWANLLICSWKTTTVSDTIQTLRTFTRAEPMDMLDHLLMTVKGPLFQNNHHWNIKVTERNSSHKKTEINTPAHAASMSEQESSGTNLSHKLDCFRLWRWAMGILWPVIHSLQEKVWVCSDQKRKLLGNTRIFQHLKKFLEQSRWALPHNT